MKRGLAFVLSIGLVAGCAQQYRPPVAAYPVRGQAVDQQTRDAYDCQAYAQQFSGNQAADTAQGVGVGALVGGLIGAAGGAAIGAATGNAGRGAAIGAAAGGVTGGTVGGVSQYNKSGDAYNRAYAACMSGKGYSVR
jgi:hypothetical protein